MGRERKRWLAEPDVSEPAFSHPRGKKQVQGEASRSGSGPGQRRYETQLGQSKTGEGEGEGDTQHQSGYWGKEEQAWAETAVSLQQFLPMSKLTLNSVSCSLVLEWRWCTQGLYSLVAGLCVDAWSAHAAVPALRRQHSNCNRECCLCVFFSRCSSLSLAPAVCGWGASLPSGLWSLSSVPVLEKSPLLSVR